MAYITTLSVMALNRAAIAESAAHGHGAGHVHAATGQDETGPGHIDAAAGHDHTGAPARATGPCRPTSAQSRASKELVASTKRGLARFVDLRAALAAGYVPHRPGREVFKHYFNPAYVTDGRVLDPTRPEGLLYAHTKRGPVVVAAIYLMNRAGEPESAVGGCLTQWHVHDNLCSNDPDNGTITGVRNRQGQCPLGQVAWAAPPMLHTWVIDIPGGPFVDRFSGGAVFRQLRTTPPRSAG
jgi:hypothetical protein